MVIIIKTNASVNIEDSVVDVEPRLFLQRLIVFIQPEEINDAFSYELCIRPSSVFDKKDLISEADKLELKISHQGCILSDHVQHYKNL